MYFIGIIPQRELKEQIVLLQKSQIKNRLPSYVPPHITLIPPFNSDSTPLLPHNTMKIISDTLPFEATISGIGSFGSHTVYIDIESVRLLEFRNIILKSLSSEGFLDNSTLWNKEFHPHITIGQRRHGLNHEELIELKTSAQKMSLIGQTFRIESINILGKVNSRNYNDVTTIKFGLLYR